MLRPVVLLMLVATTWAAEICCPEIGCFNDFAPFNGLPLPWCISDINPYYTMYTRTNPSLGQTFDAHSVPSSYSGGRRTVFIFHGYQNNGGMQWLQNLKDAFLNREDMNVVTVGWEGGADIVNYNQAASNTRSTGAYTALVFNNLVTNGGGSPSLNWCVGHSLGSHVCGHAGMKTTLGRVTGLDPAGPSFESNPDKTIGLNPTSASFVDVLHTDTSTYGTLRDVGHIDFYPAGGHSQPGCGPDVAGCSHGRSITYMEESLRQDCFQSRSSCTSYSLIPGSCSSCTCGLEPCAYMGYAAENSCQRSGIYHLDIADTAPFCVG